VEQLLAENQKEIDAILRIWRSLLRTQQRINSVIKAIVVRSFVWH
jgi:hypothetical protein